MATTTGIKFYAGNYGISTARTKATDGAIVFDKDTHSLFVNGIQYGGNIADVTFSNNVLTITKADGTSSGNATQIQLDFSNLATTSSVMAVFNEIKTELDNIETAIGNVDGSDAGWQGYTQTNYLNSATSLSDADKKLDTQIKSLSDTVSGLTTGVSDVQINTTSIKSNGVADIKVDGTYDSSTNQIATKSTVTNAIGALDVPSTGEGAITGMGAGKTIATLTETDGKVSATFQDISINGSQVSGLTGYSVSGVSGDVSSSDSLITALEKIEAKANNAGVTTFGGETGAITLGSYLTMGTGNSDHQLSVTNVDTAGTSTTDTDLATVKTVSTAVSTAINGLDTSNDVAVASVDSTNHTVTITGSVKETDGIIADGTANDVTLYFASEQSASNKIVTMAEIADLSGAMHFRSIIDSTSTTVIDAINTYYGGQNIPAAEVGDVFVDSHTGKEYVVKSLPSSGNLTSGNIEEFGSVNPQTTVASFAASTNTTGLAVTPTTASTGAISMTVDTASGYQIPTSAQLTKVDSIAVDTTNKSVTDGTNTLSNIVSDSDYAHITVTSTSVSDGTNTFSKYVHPTTTAASAAAVKVGNDSNGHVVLGDALAGSDISYTNQNMTGITTVAGALDSLQSTSGSALQSISHGTDGTYVTTTIGNKSNNDQSVGVAVTVQTMSSADSTHMGLAEASDVKSYVDTKAAVVDGSETVIVNDSNATTIVTVGGNNITTKVAFYWEEYS